MRPRRFVLPLALCVIASSLVFPAPTVGVAGAPPVSVPAAVETARAFAQIRSTPAVVQASKRHTRHILSGPADGGARDLQWALNQLGADDAWHSSTGEGVTVAVVDTGVDAGHPDLAGRVVPGFDGFKKKTAGMIDPNGHGTHVAGTIVGHGLVTGIAPGAKIMPIRAMDANGVGNTYKIVSGIMWAVNHGADIINMSIGSPEPDVSEKNAIRWARNQGVLVVAASGNDGSARAMYPAAYDDFRHDAERSGGTDDVIGVGAVDSDGQRASFSQRGNPVDLVAPGVRVLSTYTRLKHAYSFETGTSMAAPFVAGVAALALAYQRATHPDSNKIDNGNRVDAALRSSATDVGSPGRDLYMGDGEVSAAATLAFLGSPTWPGMARDLSLIGGPNGQATLKFTPPPGSSIAVLTKANGSSGARGASSPAGGTVVWSGAGGSPVTVVLKDLSPDDSYAVTVFSTSGSRQSRSVIGLRPLDWSLKQPKGRGHAKRALAIATTLPILGVVPAGPITVTYTWAGRRKLERVSAINSAQLNVPIPKAKKRLSYYASVDGGFGNWPSRSKNYALKV